MSAPEVLFRAKRSCLNRIEQLTGVHSNWLDAEIPATTGTSSPLTVPNVDPKPYLEAAGEVLDGRLKLFEIVSESYGEDPEWNRDPKSGRLAPLQFGKTLNYRDERLVGDIKYLWEPNRHYHLVTLAQAYALSGNTAYLDRIRNHVQSWIEQCPYGRGPNWCSSLELGIRLINWWLTLRLIGDLDSPVFEGDSGQHFRRLWLKCIYQHVKFIHSFYSRYSSANNHLIGEAAAVVVATSAWPYWPDFEAIGSAARKTLARESIAQNHEDGVNKEQAIWYQQFVLNFLLLAGTCTRDAADSFDEAYWNRIEAMVLFVAAMRDHAGNVPMFGDADDGFVWKLDHDQDFCPFTSLIAKWNYLAGNRDARKSEAIPSDQETLWLAAIAPGFRPMKRYQDRQRQIPTEFPEGGYYILDSDSNKRPAARMIVKAGPLGFGSIAAHGHADALSIYLSVGASEILIDPGTYAYHTDTEWRNYFRGTSAHNTVRVDGLDQSTIAGNFLWTQHATGHCEALTRTPDHDAVIVWHDGYSRLKNPVLHRRTVSHLKSDRSFVVEDVLAGSGRHEIEMYFHFAEDCYVVNNKAEWLVESGDIRVVFTFDGQFEDISLHEGDDNPPLGWVSRAFGVKRPSHAIVCRRTADLPASFATRIDY